MCMKEHDFEVSINWWNLAELQGGMNGWILLLGLLITVFGLDLADADAEWNSERTALDACRSLAAEQDRLHDFKASSESWQRCLQLQMKLSSEERESFEAEEMSKNLGRAWFKALDSSTIGQSMEELEAGCRAVDSLGLTGSKLHINFLSRLALIHDKAGDFSKAEARYKEALSLLIASKWETTTAYRDLFCNFGSVSFNLGRADALMLLKMCVDIFERRKEEKSVDYIAALQNYAMAQTDAALVIVLLKKCMAIAESLDMQQTDEFVTIRRNLELWTNLSSE
jgi:tetratricopeptide (TPR) repeat protein